MLLKTERLTIRPIMAEDWKSVRDIWLDFNSSAYAQYDKPHSTENEDVQPRIAKWAAANRGTAHMFFAVCLHESLIGYVAFNIRENGYEIGYCFHSAYHGNGYARESLLALFAYLRTLGITRFFAGTALRNTPSVKLLTSLGFKLIKQEKVSFYKDAAGNEIVFDGGIFERAGMEIREYTKERIPDVLRFERDLRTEENFWGWELDEKYIADVTASFENPAFSNSLSLLAYMDGKVVGRIDCALIHSHFDGSVKAYLDWICVVKSYRHQGVAQTLMNTLRRELKELGVDTLIGLIASNEDAQRFYRSLPNALIRDEGIWIDL